MMVSNCPRCQIVLGVKLSMVSNCPPCMVGVKLSAVSNCPITFHCCCFFKDHHEKIVGIWSWVWVDWSAMHDMRGSKVHLPKINFQLSTRTWFLLLSKSAFQRKALENNFIQNFTERYVSLQTGRLPYSPPFLIFANLDFHLRESVKYFFAEFFFY